MSQIIPSTVAELIGLWPSAEVFSDDLRLKYRSHGRVMKMRGAIPCARWDDVILAASRRGIDGINHTLLKRLHEKPAKPSSDHERAA